MEGDEAMTPETPFAGQAPRWAGHSALDSGIDDSPMPLAWAVVGWAFGPWEIFQLRFKRVMRFFPAGSVSVQDLVAPFAQSAFQQRLVFAAAGAEGIVGLLRGGGEFAADAGAEAGDDEELGGEFAVVEQRQERGVAFRDGQRDIGLVVAGEFLGLHAGFDGSLDRVFDLKQTLGLRRRLARHEGGIGHGEVLLVDAAGGEGRVFPSLVGGVGEDGCEQLCNAGEDLMHRHLRGATARGIGRIAIHAILGGIDVNGGEVRGAELIEGVEDLAEFVGLVGFEALGGDGVEAFEDPAIEERDLKFEI